MMLLMAMLSWQVQKKMNGSMQLNVQCRWLFLYSSTSEYLIVRCAFAVELTTTHFALLVVRVEENGLNQFVELMVLLTSLLATLAARTYSETQSVNSAYCITNHWFHASASRVVLFPALYMYRKNHDGLLDVHKPEPDLQWILSQTYEKLGKESDLGAS